MLYPHVEPHHHAYLERGAGGRIYYEECGNVKGEPIVMLHGGPGAGCSAMSRRFFNLNKYRVILWDQRGGARSASSTQNPGDRERMLKHLSFTSMLEDMEALRAHLSIAQWSIFGGSWGTTMALGYAQAHPLRVKRMLLRGVFTATPSEINWLYSPNGAAQMFPKEWDVFLSHLDALREACSLQPKGAQEALKWRDILEVFDHALRHEARQIQERAAQAWGAWEQSIMSLQGVPLSSAADHQRNYDMGLISCHLFLNDPVLNSKQLWERMHTIETIPCTIVQGQFDVVTPAQTAWRLSQTLKDCELQLVRQAGHASSDSDLASALVKVLDNWVF